MTNPWNVGDCYAYKLHGKYAKGNGYYGKYIVFLKTGEIVIHENNEEITYNIIMKFDEIFDDLPDVSMLKGIRPLTYLPVEYLHGGENGISYPDDVTENEFSEFRKDIMETFGWGFLRWCFFESKHCSERFFKYLGKMDDISDYANYELCGPFSNPVDEERRMIEIHNGWKGIEY